jgi:hypothetical protein
MQLYNTNEHYNCLHVVNINEDAILCDVSVSLHNILLAVGSFEFVSNGIRTQFYISQSRIGTLLKKLVWDFPDQKDYSLFSNPQFRNVVNVANKKHGFG